MRGEFGVRRGHPLPYGATARREGVNFSVYSKHASELSLVLFVPGEAEPVLELPLDRALQQDGRRLARAGVRPRPGDRVRLSRRRTRRASAGALPMRFDSRRILIDPYSKSVAGPRALGRGERAPRAGWGGCARA